MSQGPVLHVLSGDLAGRAYRVEDREFIIGRSPDCDLVIPKRYISREHARIVARKKGFVVTSLSEKNPVQLKDRPVNKAPLSDGDEFEVCGIRFRFALRGTVRKRKVDAVRMDGSGSAANQRVDDGWQSESEPEDDGWESEPADAAADDGWESEPTDAGADDGWESEPAGAAADDGWESEPTDAGVDDGWEDEEEGDWEDEPRPTQSEPKGKGKSRSSRSKGARDEKPKKADKGKGKGKGSVVFGDDDDDTEEVNEKTAELNPTVDPDDPDYDPFAEVDNQVKAEKKGVDPAREKMLRILVVVAVLGLAFAGFVVKKVLEPPALSVVEHNDGEEIVVAVDEVKVIEYPYADTNPPEGHDTRRINFKGQYQKFHEDDSVQVEWLNYKNRLVLLIRGLEEGPSTFTVFFPASNTRRVFRINVEGDPPLQVAREARQEELKLLKPNQLRQMLSQAVSRGDGYIEGYGPDKEHFLWLALKEYEQAVDAGGAMLQQRALNDKDREKLSEANTKAEATLEEYEKKRDILQQRYGQTFEQKRKKKYKLNALRSLMRGIGNDQDFQFIRLKFILEDTQGFNERWNGF